MLKALQWVLLVLTIASLIAAMSIASVAVALHLVSKTPRQRNYLVVGFLGAVPVYSHMLKTAAHDEKIIDRSWLAS